MLIVTTTLELDTRLNAEWHLKFRRQCTNQGLRLFPSVRLEVSNLSIQHLAHPPIPEAVMFHPFGQQRAIRLDLQIA